MDRKGITAVTLAIVTLVVWTIYNSREMQKTAAEQAKKKAEIAAQQPAVQPDKAADKPATPDQPAPPPAPVVEAKTEMLVTPSVEWNFSNLGGGITKASLLKHEGESGRRMTLNEFGTVPIGALTEVAGEDITAAFNPTVDKDAGTISYERTTPGGLQIVKKFTVPKAGDPEEYLVKLDVTFTNHSDKPLKLPGYFVYTGAAAPIHQRDQAIYTGFTFDSAPEFVHSGWFGAGGFWMFSHPERPAYPEKPAKYPRMTWAGVTNQYFSTIISPQMTSKDYSVQSQQLGETIWARRFHVNDEAWKATGRSTEGQSGDQRFAVDGAIGMPALALDAGKDWAQSFKIYAGPREYSRVKNLGSNEEKIMDFGTWGIVSKTLLNALNWLNARLGSYAAAIIVLTICIKLLLWPLQNKATQSMKKMSLLGPKMTELREKYADDPQKLNTEIMGLYKSYGVNPFGGCLPMLIQIPIFFGFYNMLGKAVELRNSKFLWVHDLSLPDTIWHIPYINFGLNLLPLLMAATMFWSMAISPKSGDQMQQKMFMFMPLIFVFMCYNFASALALYWTVQNLFSVAQLYLTRNQAPPTLQKVAVPKKKKR